jgi:hypothetical protein
MMMFNIQYKGVRFVNFGVVAIRNWSVSNLENDPPQMVFYFLFGGNRKNKRSVDGRIVHDRKMRD